MTETQLKLIQLKKKYTNLPITLLQMKLKVTYDEAAKLLDWLQEYEKSDKK